MDHVCVQPAGRPTRLGRAQPAGAEWETGAAEAVRGSRTDADVHDARTVTRATVTATVLDRARPRVLVARLARIVVIGHRA